MDSPLVTYRKPDEHMGEGVKDAFYRNLATTLSDAQVIILENEEPPAQITIQIAFPEFTRNRTMGRYGLFAALLSRNNLYKTRYSFETQGVNVFG